MNDYVLKYGFQEDPVAQKLREYTAQNHPRAVMMGDPVEAAFFATMIPSWNVRRIIEVGVFTGYTTLVMAQALRKQQQQQPTQSTQPTIVGLDINDEFTSIGQPYWKEAGVDDFIDLRIGPAVDTMKALIGDGQTGTFDFVFIDADKVSYRQYYELALTLIRPNGIIAIDNVLWFGRVLDETTYQDDDTVALRALSKFIQEQDDRVEHVLLPFADGVTLVRKR